MGAVQVTDPHPHRFAGNLLTIDVAMSARTELVAVLTAEQVLELADQIDHDSGGEHFAVRVTPTWVNVDETRNVVEIIGCAEQ